MVDSTLHLVLFIQIILNYVSVVYIIMYYRGGYSQPVPTSLDRTLNIVYLGTMEDQSQVVIPVKLTK